MISILKILMVEDFPATLLDPKTEFSDPFRSLDRFLVRLRQGYSYNWRVRFFNSKMEIQRFPLLYR
jgi:hypothetical protein